MTQKAPGKAFRKGISLTKLIRMFPNDLEAERWFEGRIWPKGPYCPKCGSFNVQTPIKHTSMTHRCRDCKDKYRFSLKTGNVMEGTKLGYQTWAIALYLVMTNLKGVSSVKLHRDLEITQKSAWHLAHRLRKTMADDAHNFAGPSEVDESFWGGKEKNKHSSKKLKAGRGPVGKTPVAGIKDRTTNKVMARVVPDTSAATLQDFVSDSTKDGSTVYTDDAVAYKGLKNREHESVKHSVGEYVRDMAHTNGIESFWAMMRRGQHGVYHKMSPKHLQRYVFEFAGRHNIRSADTEDQMAFTAKRMIGRRLKYETLTADNGLHNGLKQ